jgi:hypothetical protein
LLAVRLGLGLKFNPKPKPKSTLRKLHTVTVLEEWMSKKLAIAFVIIGFILIVLYPIGYIGGFFELSLQTRTIMLIGIILAVVGMLMVNKKNSARLTNNITS